MALANFGESTLCQSFRVDAALTLCRRGLNFSFAAAIAPSPKAVRKLRPKFYIRRVFRSELQTIQDDHECLFTQYCLSRSSRVINVPMGLLDATTFLPARRE
jgi:hypothetical protein